MSRPIWRWRPLNTCDVPEHEAGLNPQMKDLENWVGRRRPDIMSGMPEHVGAIVDNAIDSHTGDTVATELKSTDVSGGVTEKGGIRVTASGTCSGGAGAKTITLNWGGIEIGTIAVGSGTQTWWLLAEFWNINNTQNQRWLFRTWDGITMETMELGTDDVDTG